MAFEERLPIFNHYGSAVVDNSKDKLLVPQSKALERLQQFFQRNESGRKLIGMVSMPTGSGKTGVISCLPYFLGKCMDAETHKPLHLFNKPVLVVAPDLTIAEQLERRLTVSAGGKGENFLLDKNIIPPTFPDAFPKGVMIKETAHLDNPEYLGTHDIVITNVHKFLDDNSLPDDFFKLVIVDEAHHHPASMWRRIVDKCKNHAMVAFFTATPFRGDKKPVLKDEDGELVYNLSLEEARTQRIIRRINWCPVRSDEHDSKRLYQLLLQEVKTIQERKNNENPLPGNTPHMAIAITPNIGEAKEVAKIWNELWGSPDSAIAYHSKQKPEKKKQLMKRIRSNKVKLVVVVEMLLEGFDHPPISIAAILTKIVSKVKFAQFVGRAQRIVRGQGCDESDEIFADIVTHSYFQQEQNYVGYDEALLITVDD